MNHFCIPNRSVDRCKLPKGQSYE